MYEEIDDEEQEEASYKPALFTYVGKSVIVKIGKTRDNFFSGHMYIYNREFVTFTNPARIIKVKDITSVRELTPLRELPHAKKLEEILV